MKAQGLLYLQLLSLITFSCQQKDRDITALIFETVRAQIPNLVGYASFPISNSQQAAPNSHYQIGTRL